MPYFIKEVNRKTEEFEKFLNDEEYYAYETKDKEYIDFLKRTNQYTEEKKGDKK